MKVRILSNLRHDGTDFAPDEVVELNDDVAQGLIADGVVVESTREDELVAEAKAKAKAEAAAGKPAKPNKPAAKPAAGKPKAEKADAGGHAAPDDDSFTFQGDEFKTRVTSAGKTQYVKNGRLTGEAEYTAALEAHQAEQE